MQKRLRQKSIPKNAYDAGFSRVCLYITLQCFWKQYVKDAFYYDRTVRKWRGDYSNVISSSS